MSFSDDSSSDEEQWEREGYHLGDPWDNDRLEEERKNGHDQSYLADLYLQMRKSIRRYRLAKGQFGPRRRFKPRISKRVSAEYMKKQKRSSYKKNGATIKRHGFFLGATFVTLDQAGARGREHEEEVSREGLHRRHGAQRPTLQRSRVDMPEANHGVSGKQRGQRDPIWS